MAGRMSKEPRSSVVSLADEEKVKDVLVSTVLGLWEVVNNLTRLRPSKKDRYGCPFSAQRAFRKVRGSIAR